MYISCFFLFFLSPVFFSHTWQFLSTRIIFSSAPSNQLSSYFNCYPLFSPPLPLSPSLSLSSLSLPLFLSLPLSFSLSLPPSLSLSPSPCLSLPLPLSHPLFSNKIVGGEFERMVSNCGGLAAIASFDVHARCTGRVFDNIYTLVEQVGGQLHDFGYSLVSATVWRGRGSGGRKRVKK